MTPPATLFHYCSSDAFSNIIASRSVRLSSLLLSNDYNEGQSVVDLIKSFLNSKRYSENDRQLIFNWLSIFKEHFHGIGFCLSEKKDSLSQWRGYADDGAGFSIGFSKLILKNFQVTNGNRTISLKKINYEELDHFSKIAPIIKNLEQICNDKKYKVAIAGLLALASEDNQIVQKGKDDEKKRELLTALLPISDELFTLKNSAFSEEQEWRLISTIEGDDFSGVGVYTKNNKLIPFDSININGLVTTSIVEVMVGPKNQTPQSVIKKWIKGQGFSNVNVSKSKATYR